MHDFGLLFGAGISVLCLVLFMEMVVAGIRSGRLATEAQTPPIIFRERPVAFVALCSLYLTTACGFAYVGILAVVRLLIQM